MKTFKNCAPGERTLEFPYCRKCPTNDHFMVFYVNKKVHNFRLFELVYRYYTQDYYIKCEKLKYKYFVQERYLNNPFGHHLDQEYEISDDQYDYEFEVPEGS